MKKENRRLKEWLIKRLTFCVAAIIFGFLLLQILSVVYLKETISLETIGLGAGAGGAMWAILHTLKQIYLEK